jgi:hypothetical protein
MILSFFAFQHTHPFNLPGEDRRGISSAVPLCVNSGLDDGRRTTTMEFQGRSTVLASIDSSLAAAGLQPGDIVHTVNGARVSSSDEVLRAVSDDGGLLSFFSSPRTHNRICVWRPGTVRCFRKQGQPLGLVLDRVPGLGLAVKSAMPGGCASDSGHDWSAASIILRSVNGVEVSSAQEILQLLPAADDWLQLGILTNIVCEAPVPRPSAPMSTSSAAAGASTADGGQSPSTSTLLPSPLQITILDVLTPASFHNAIAVIYALGGSTNAVLHLLALAREAHIEVSQQV